MTLLSQAKGLIFMADEDILKLILAKLDNLESEVSDIKSTMATKEELAAVKDDVAALKGEVGDIKATMATKDDLAAVKDDVAALKGEVGDIKAAMATKDDLAALKEEIAVNVVSLVSDNILPAMEAMEERLTGRIDELSDRMGTVELLSGQNYTDIVKLRLAK